MHSSNFKSRASGTMTPKRLIIVLDPSTLSTDLRSATSLFKTAYTYNGVDLLQSKATSLQLFKRQTKLHHLAAITKNTDDVRISVLD